MCSYSIGTNIYNGPSTHNEYISDLPLGSPAGSFCSGGTFSIYSKIDSTNTNCTNMYLGITVDGKHITALNYPYPN